MSVREQWRVGLLLVLLLGSAFALFAPQGGNSNNLNANTSSGPTNLKYGLELAGGTRIRAPVNGVTAEQAHVTNGTSQTDIQKTVSKKLPNVSQSDVKFRATGQNVGTVEVFSKTIKPAQLKSALNSAGIKHGTVRQGVTDQTRKEIVNVLGKKVSSAGLSGGRVQEVKAANGDHYIQIEMPNTNESEMQDLVTHRGKVSIVAHYPTKNGSANTTVITKQDLSNIGTAQQYQNMKGSPWGVSVSLTDSGGKHFANVMKKRGFTSQQGVGACQYPQKSADKAGYCLYTETDGKIVSGVSMGDLAQSINNGDFQNNPSFTITTGQNGSEARKIQINLQAGALPASLNTGAGTTTYLAPNLASQFKLYSLLAGIAAVLAVSGVVFIRYGKKEVALPMILTALSEVFILLGFAAAISLPLDLSHIAGFIAVIGTGVDDLIIIADEVINEGNVSSSRVFQSRFRKAFWVIGAAAATTIIAMSPLAVLSLGDLRGFALITILGVLIGVLVTRPAYGDILRYLLTDR